MQRFIPACAGNITSRRQAPPTSAVHPRVCGEHGRRSWRVAPITGSSPRVRGTFRLESLYALSRRFIPACAGNIPAGARRHARPTVHPRVCGEHHLPLNKLCQSPGSSPRVRGTSTDCSVDRTRTRFIPACAGNITNAGARAPQSPVHPRVCGEHGGRPLSHSPVRGSSPRVRGTCNGAEHGDDLRRFIPACAGNILIPSRLQAAIPVHPRVCGEHRLQVRVLSSSIGSSPRVRGTLPRQRGTCYRLRFIPACAGNIC